VKVKASALAYAPRPRGGGQGAQGRSRGCQRLPAAMPDRHPVGLAQQARQHRGASRYYREWQPGQDLIAAGGGAGRRSAEIAAGPDGSIARSAPLGAAAPLPRGGLVGRGFCGRLAPRGGTASGDAAAQTLRGTQVACVGPSVGFGVGSSVGSPTASATVGQGRDRQGCGACQRSSTRRRRVPHPRAAPRLRPPRAVTGAGRRARLRHPVKPRMGAPPRRRRGGVPDIRGLTGRHRCPCCTAWVRA